MNKKITNCCMRGDNEKINEEMVLDIAGRCSDWRE